MEDVTWHVPPHCGGQIVEVAYGSDAGRPFKRVTDRSRAADDPRRETYYETPDDYRTGLDWAPWTGAIDVRDGRGRRCRREIPWRPVSRDGWPTDA